MKRLVLAGLLTGFSTAALAAMSGLMMTTDYFPLVDGARYDYVFASGPHTTATAVMHAGQTWAGANGLTSMHTRFVCQPAVPCNPDSIEFYRMDPDGMHYFGGNTATPDDALHYMMSFTSPDWLLKNPVTPGTMMGPGMGYQSPDTWHS